MPTSYQVIARKWRPQTFGDVVGQDHVVRTLSNSIARGRIAHAYLFVGPRGTGKTSTARIFAKALNCTDGPKADFDPEDPAVQSIASGTHLDVIEIDGASNNGVEQVRDLRETARYAPAQGRFKVYIIDEVHMLSTQAFNALLKTLEEPPAHVKFIFATTDVDKVLPTILSRCQRFDLKPIPPELIAERLRRIAVAEKIAIADAALAAVARLADGSLRDAQSILDQLISFCGQEIGEADVLDVYGLAAEGKVAELAGSVAAGDHRKIVALVDEFDAAGRDLVRILGDLQREARTALLDAISQGGRSGRLGGISLTTEQLTRMLDALREGEGSVKLGLGERVNFEVALLKAVEASRSRAIDSLIKELAAMAGGSDAAGAEPKKKDRLSELDRRLRARLNVLEVDRAGPGAIDGLSASAKPAGVERAVPSALVSPASPESASRLKRPTFQARESEPEPAPAEEPVSDLSAPSMVAEEASYLAGAPIEDVPPAPPPAPAAPKLPPLAGLVNRVPEGVRAALEEHFRAKFVRVRAVPKK